jgi:hypothetical protein
VIASTTDRINDRVAELESMGCSATGFVGDLMVDGVASSLVDATLAVPAVSTSASTTRG